MRRQHFGLGYALEMIARRRPIERTGKYDVWDERRKNDVARSSQPKFESARWVEVPAGTIADPTFISDVQVERLAAACERHASTGPTVVNG